MFDTKASIIRNLGFVVIGLLCVVLALFPAMVRMGAPGLIWNRCTDVRAWFYNRQKESKARGMP